jgi:tetratricopeptide (TPR) repeat protein
MEFNINEFKAKLQNSLDSFAFEEATNLCNELISSLFQTTQPIPIKEAEKILQWLRNKRMFSLMLKVADAFLQSGLESYKINRQYAQALIDLGSYTSAISILQNLISKINSEFPTDFNNHPEYIEAKGLLGRLYKQLYVNVKNPSFPQSIDFLRKGITFYHDVYKMDKSKIWHGINTVA